MIKINNVLIPLLLGVAMLLLLVFLITRIAVNALIQGAQSLLAIASARPRTSR